MTSAVCRNEYDCARSKQKTMSLLVSCFVFINLSVVIIYCYIPSLLILGTVSTLGWDGVASHFLSVDTSIRLVIPVGHVIMVSVFHMDIPGRFHSCEPNGYVSFHDSDDFSRELRVLCGNTIPGPEVYDLDSGVFYVRFSSLASYKGADSGAAIFGVVASGSWASDLCISVGLCDTCRTLNSHCANRTAPLLLHCSERG